jgi:hydroxyquinol 1,2-dioxygenase
MNSTTEPTLTARVLAQFQGTADPRLREILLALVSHLHAFAEETSLTFGEWLNGIEFLTRVGQMCDDNRQEFILLSDVLGLSMLVDGIENHDLGDATESTVLGPFFVEKAPVQPIDADIAMGHDGEPLHVTAIVTSDDGQPLRNAEVIVWQCDSDGFYDVQHAQREGFFLRGRFRTDAQGLVRFWTIVSPPYPIPHDGPVGDLLDLSGRHPWRPAHIHFRIAAEQHRTLVTHLFPRGGPYLDSDVVFGVKQSLIMDLADHGPGIGPNGRDCPDGWKSLTHTFRLSSN